MKAGVTARRSHTFQPAGGEMCRQVRHARRGLTQPGVGGRRLASSGRQQALQGWIIQGWGCQAWMLQPPRGVALQSGALPMQAACSSIRAEIC